ncbi:MAG TPA: TIM barrel protein [Bryobacteraceae bacterium]|jgi:sugar phosphate isomerase/epimerase|nr:TIM barrel protein [Bryobacteraceae bacterium]
MTRRDLLAAGAASTLIALKAAAAQGPSPKALLGGSPTCFSVRARAARENHEEFDIIEHCHELGLAGAESILLAPTPEAVKSIRQKVDKYNMTVILNTRLPKTESDVSQFDTAVAACKEAGAMALHAAMTGRRYEQFDTLEAFQANFAQCQKTIALAEPILRKHRMPLAIENHKGWRAAEQAAWLKRVSSEWVGVCLDMGNNISLCEMPDETFELLTPFAIFSHLKDMGVEEYADGFLLSEVPFGQGVINLKERVEQLRRKNPKMLFCLEMITRDPLTVPVFTDKYWVTFSGPQEEIPGRDVAKIFELVRKNPPKTPLPRPDGLPIADRVKVEDDYNLACIRYARQNLDM